ncbi:MAG: DUF547 domain-containing protein [Cyanobacteria bacterium J069]|nr:MAG: DUF547 domain-containing protein [Cyanobacteria bacterium J069]
MVKPLPLVLAGAIALLSGCTIPLAQGDRPILQETTVSDAAFSYDGYATVLQTYVNADGLVDYPALQANPQLLKAFIEQLGAVSPDTYSSWSESDKIAFLINAYNAITLESIINQNPLKGSIKDIFGVWNFQKHRLKGESVTLDKIEHEILRKEFQEPRIHAALVCAAISCPPLRQEPYIGERLNQQLDDQSQKWLSSAHGLQIDREQNQVLISAIFDWFGDDWKPQYANETQFTGSPKDRAALNFISNYVSPEDKAYLSAGNYKLGYLNYDWSLNKQ